MRRPLLILATAAVALALALAGCGKKPSFVDPPQGREADKFPGTYPNPKTDPKPGQPPSGARFP
ncbi:hypothetical protein GAY33_10805 [Azospirillum brasilense]|uniref:hypothetical protein n=1 Tax=Azospirillum argentinense TaxID=2970906 RepID=UPI00190C420A|nr:hypothetical protein [Azospirillum argentinense]MBK3799715.1 hypothetical protein [Azospirillum argentinense]